MSDANLVMDKIRKELKKGLPSKKKILSSLLDLLKRDKYPSLSDFEFYDIVGEIYELNLDYNLNLNMLFYPIYNDLKKKIKKLFDDEKMLEMELKSKWKSKEIASLLLNLRVAEEYQRFTDSEYADIVESAYKLNPQGFMTYVYPQIKSINKSSIEPIKKDLIELIENLNNETI